MLANLPVLNRVSVASPCTADWNDMAGDDRVRHCGLCDKNVYNFSAMTSAEVVDLVREKEGHLCGRFFRRHDGTMLTADCSVGAHHRIGRKRQLSGIMAAFASFFFAGCLDGEPEGRRTGGGEEGRTQVPGGLKQILIPLNTPPEPRVFMGEVCIEPAPVPAGQPQPKAGQ